MSAIPHFAVFYNLTSQIVEKTVHIDYSPNDSEDNIKRGLAAHKETWQGIVFIPEHRISDMDTILADMGITRARPNG